METLKQVGGAVVPKALVWMTEQEVLKILLSRLLPGASLSQLHKTSVVAVSTTHALYCVYRHIPFALKPSLQTHPFSRVNETGVTYISWSTAYFLWDIVECLRYRHLYSGSTWIHALIVFVGLLCPLKPFHAGQFVAHALLLYEASTPFLNFVTLQKIWKLPPSRLFRSGRLLFILSFFLVRIVFGTYITCFFMKSAPNFSSLPANLATRTAIVGTCGLNYFWFFFILRKALKKFRTS
jgi:hypothetical protein